jgi:hypothetical protein
MSLRREREHISRPLNAVVFPVMVPRREMDVRATIPERGADRLHNRLLAFDLMRAGLFLRCNAFWSENLTQCAKKAHVVSGVAVTRRGVGRAAGGPTAPTLRRRRSSGIDRPSCAGLPGPQGDLLQLLSRLRDNAHVHGKPRAFGRGGSKESASPAVFFLSNHSDQVRFESASAYFRTRRLNQTNNNWGGKHE